MTCRRTSTSRAALTPRICLTAAALLLLRAGALSAQEETIPGEPLSFAAAAELAVGADSKVARLSRELQDQLDSLGWRGYLDAISLRLSGSVGGDIVRPWSGLVATSAAEGSALLSARLDLDPRLAVTGTLGATGTYAADTEPDPAAGGGQETGREGLSGSLQVTYAPFADRTAGDRTELLAESTSADLAEAIAAAAYRGITALIDAVSAAMETDLLTRRQEVEEWSLANTRALRAHDRATEDQLEAAQDAARAAAERVVRSELSAERSVEVLARTLGIPASTVSLPAIADLDTELIMGQAREFLAAAATAGAPAGSASTAEVRSLAARLALRDASVVTAELQLRTAGLNVEAARRFAPQLSVTASAASPVWQPGAATQSWSYKIGAEITLSPSQWDGSAVSDALEDLQAAQDDYAYAVRLAELDVLGGLNELKFALDSVEAERQDRASAEQDLVEAQFRYERGYITALALEQARLAVLSAKHELGTARLTVVGRMAGIDYGQW